jgi:hypothetical protein
MISYTVCRFEIVSVSRDFALTKQLFYLMRCQGMTLIHSRFAQQVIG